MIIIEIQEMKHEFFQIKHENYYKFYTLS